MTDIDPTTDEITEEVTPKKRGPKPKVATPTPVVAATTNGAASVDPHASTTTASGDRIFRKQITYTHDLYKLLVASFKKNVEVDGRQPRYEDAEHVHWFHTIDSDGKTQELSNSVGGHFHKMKVTHQGPGKAPLVECISGPLRKVSRKNEYGKWISAFAPFNAVDHHTHETIYITSGEVKPRERNVEAAIYTTQVEAKTAPIAGVEG